MAGFGGGNAMAMAIRLGVVGLLFPSTRAEGVEFSALAPGWFRLFWAIPSQN